MIALALALAALGGNDGGRALSWADRLYPKGIPPRYDVEQALEAYRRVAKRYPENRGAWLGEAKCLQACGCYSEAWACFVNAGAGAAAVEAQVRTRIAASLDAQRKPLKTVQVERVPRTGDRWIALLVKRKLGNGKDGTEYEPTTFSDPRVALVRAIPGRAATVLSVDRIDRDAVGAFGCWLVVTDLEWHRNPAAIVWVDNGGADHDSNAQYVVAICGAKLRYIRSLYGDLGDSLEPATPRHGFRVVTVATFKVWWPDVYEWRRGEFRFANPTNPEVYRALEGRAPSPRGLNRNEYPYWMHFAARLGIEGRFSEAAHAWRAAERTCRKAIGARTSSPYYDGGFYGRAIENLQDIRRRLKWLARGDYGHWLLYRPYDFDLQVPPYRLGDARPVR